MKFARITLGTDPVENPKEAWDEISRIINKEKDIYEEKYQEYKGLETDIFLELLGRERLGIKLFTDKNFLINSENLDECINGCKKTVRDELTDYQTSLYDRDEILKPFLKDMNYRQIAFTKSYLNKEKCEILKEILKDLTPDRIKNVGMYFSEEKCEILKEVLRYLDSYQIETVGKYLTEEECKVLKLNKDHLSKLNTLGDFKAYLF